MLKNALPEANPPPAENLDEGLASLESAFAEKQEALDQVRAQLKASEEELAWRWLRRI